MTFDSEEIIPPVWNIGDVILGLYEVKQVFKSGGMGLVYRVHHREWNMDLAVKSPRPELLRGLSNLDRFERECETWVNLGLHPHTVACYYVRRLGGVARTFAEFVEGGTLLDWIRSRRLYAGAHDSALRRILDIAIQAAWGLQHAHEQKLVHQDVKPGNILMASDGIAKVSDFGFAKGTSILPRNALLSEEQSVLVSSGGCTPVYCSPEQAKGEAVTRRTDIWSWAVSVLHMFSGDILWRIGPAAPAAVDPLFQHGAKCSEIPRLPRAVASLLKSCLHCSPAGRPDAMQDVARELIQIYEHSFNGRYPRQIPKALDLTADNFNNRALSLWDIGKRDECFDAFAKALEATPNHPLSLYNRGLITWRLAKATDDQIIKNLSEAKKLEGFASQAAYLLGLIHIERGDAEGARRELEESRGSVEFRSEVESALALVRREGSKWGGCAPKVAGPTGTMNSISVASDQDLMVSCGTDSNVRLWSLRRTECLAVLQGHKATVQSVCISKDGKVAVSGAWDRTVRVWDLEKRALAMTLEGHTEHVTCVGLLPDGERALSASIDRTIRIWDLKSGRNLHVFQGHDGGVVSLAVAANGKLVLSGSLDGTIRLWSLTDLEELGGIRAPSLGGPAVALSPNCQRALTAVSYEHNANLWDFMKGELVAVLKGHNSAVRSTMFTPDGDFALTGGGDGTVRLWNLCTGRCLRTFDGAGWQVSAVSRMDDGRFVAFSSGGEFACLLQVAIGVASPFVVARPVAVTQQQAKQEQFKSLISKAAQLLDASSPRQACWVVEQALTLPDCAQSAECLSLLRKIGERGVTIRLHSAWTLRTLEGHGFAVYSVTFSKDGRLLLSAGVDNEIRVWNLADGRRIQTLRGHSNTVTAAAFSYDGKRIVSGSFDNSVRVWDVRSGECLVQLDDLGHARVVAFSPDGQFLFVGGGDFIFTAWQIRTGRNVQRIAHDGFSPRAIAISPDGRRALVGNYEKSVSFWDLANVRCLHTFDLRYPTSTATALTPDAAVGASTSNDGVLRLWDLTDYRCLKEMRASDAGVGGNCALCFTPDGRFVISAASKVRLWTVRDAQVTNDFAGLNGPAHCVAVSPDSRFVAAGAEDRTVRLWECRWSYDFPNSA